MHHTHFSWLSLSCAHVYVCSFVISFCPTAVCFKCWALSSSLSLSVHVCVCVCVHWGTTHDDSHCPQHYTSFNQFPTLDNCRVGNCKIAMIKIYIYNGVRTSFDFLSSENDPMETMFSGICSVVQLFDYLLSCSL